MPLINQKIFLQFLITLFSLAVSIGMIKADEITTNNRLDKIPLAVNLFSDGQQQQINGKVILLYVSAPHCPFCKKLEKEILNPLIKSGEYREKLILRKINWNSKSQIINFFGEKQRPRDLLKKYNIRITPTLLFLDSEGNQVSQQLLGYRGGEFYWFYFDSGIRKANIVIKNQ